MDYELKAGTLTRRGEGRPLARLRMGLCGPGRQILAPDGTLLLRTEIRRLDGPPGSAGDLRYTRYVMCGRGGEQLATGAPRYAEDDDPARVGWPICRMPRADRVLVQMGEERYVLRMKTDREYCMEDGAGERVLHIVHRGVMGGWQLETGRDFPAEILCGLFAFCRYLESENQFVAV